MLELHSSLISIGQVVLGGWVAFAGFLIGGVWLLLRVANRISNATEQDARFEWRTSFLLAFLGVVAYFVIDYLF